MSNISVGARNYDNGLVIQTKPEIDTNEFGMKSATLRFLLNNTKWPAMEPSRTTPCPNFIAGDTDTTNFLYNIPFMAAQTVRWTHNGHSPGVGILEVLCQGAILDASNSNRGVQSVPLLTKGEGYTNMSTVLFAGGTPNTNASAWAPLEIRTGTAWVSRGQGYQVNDVVSVGGGTTVHRATYHIDSVDANGVVLDMHILDRGAYYYVAPYNPATLNGGHGTGLHVNLDWRVKRIDIVDPGSYIGTPTVSLTGGTFTTPATVGAPVMGGGDAENATTVPFDPISTTKDTLTFISYTAGTVSVPALQARVATTAPLTNYSVLGQDTLEGWYPPGYEVPLPPQDEVQLSVGDRILIKDQGFQRENGLYYVQSIGAYPSFVGGPDGRNWVLRRVDEMNSVAEVNAAPNTHINSGTVNADTVWDCTSTITNLGIDPIVFVLAGGSATFVPQFQITIEYHAIDLHFEYMAGLRSKRPRFLQDEYALNSDGEIVTNPADGTTVLLAIDSVTGANIDATGNPGLPVAVADADWKSQVKYKGTSGRFEQTPAGALWHVLETATIKIEHIPQTL